MCESTPGRDGISGLGNNVVDSQDGLLIIGEISVSHSKEYTSQIEWDAGMNAQQVPKESVYEWIRGEGMDKRYGWVIDGVIALPVPAMTRM